MLQDTITQEPTTDKRRRLNIRTLHDILNDKTSPPPAIVGRGILLDRTLSIIYGPPKSRKSFLAMNFAIAIATGKPFAGFQIHHAERVLLLSAEGGMYPNRERLQKMCAAIGVTDAPIAVSFCARLNLNHDIDLDYLRENIADFHPRVLMIDPLIRFHDSDENSSTDMAMFFTRLRGLMEQFGMACMLVTHTGKDQSREIRGSSAIMGECDAALSMKTDGDESTIRFDMRFVNTPDDVTLRFNTDTLWFEEANLSPVVKCLIQSGSEMEKLELVKMLKVQSGIEKSQAYECIKRAEASGQIQLANGKYRVSMN